MCLTPSECQLLILYREQTYFNTKLKKMRLEAEAKAKKEREGKKD